LLLILLHDCGVPGIVLLHIVPFVYDKYEDVIDHHAQKAADVASYHYKNMDAAVLSKIPRAPAKQKKI
jgi:predicted secreted Zn-dependent protease